MKKEDLQRILKACDYFGERDIAVEIIERPEDREQFEFELTYYYDGVGSERGKEILIRFFKYILKQIKDNGLYEEFIKIGMSKNIRAFTRMIEAETEFSVEVAKQYILENGFTYNSTVMIIATGDVDFIKECAESLEMKSNWYLIADLVSATRESTYIQSFIENEISANAKECRIKNTT